MTEDQLRELLLRGLDGIRRWESAWRPFEQHPSLTLESNTARDAIDELVARLADNYPFFHPDYAGQMLRPPHPIAWLAYALAARINPNNHALDGGPATAELERECIGQLAAMFGLESPFLGHLTTSGTAANLEALWVASRLQPGKAIVFSQEAHYTHKRVCELLRVRSIELPADENGKLTCAALDAAGAQADIGTVVVTAGTTAAGAVDPIDEIVEFASSNHWRVHADAAYGGFFATIADVASAGMAAAPWHALARCDSIVVDPHKHGLQPYGCGAVLFADPNVGTLYKHDSPYTYFTSKDLHLGEISLECSRPGAAAAALWTTLRCFSLDRHGLGASLLASRHAALIAWNLMKESPTLTPVIAPDLDIITVAPLGRGETVRVSVVSERSEKIFQSLQREPTPLYVALWRVPRAFGELVLPELEWDEEHCTVLRSVLMKPEHEGSALELIQRLAGWPALLPA